MSIYRRKRNGKRSAKFTAEFRYHGKPFRRGGFIDRESASFWLNAQKLKLFRGEVGYIKPMSNAVVIPMIRKFAEHLESRGRDAKYVQVAELRLERLAGECGWVTIGHITEPSLEAWKGSESRQADKRKAIGPRTKNQFIAIAKEFGAWLKRPAGKLPSNPLADVDLMPAKHNDNYRRAATEAELNALLATCGPERRRYYLFRIYQSALRGRTVGRLTWRMLHLDATPPFAKTPAEANKSRKEQKYVLRLDIAQELRNLRKEAKAKADDLVFPNAADLDDLRDDWKNAGVQFDDGRGNGRLDYHALRASLVELGKNAGLTAFQIMEIGGWKNLNTVTRHYNKRSVPADVGAAMERLPTLGKLRRA